MRDTFFKQAPCYKLKPLYKLMIALIIILLFGTALFQSNAFLSKNEPNEATILIVEGWLPDYALRQAIDIFQQGNYEKIITTGGPLEIGSYLKEHKDYAHVAKASLLAMGMTEENVIAVPAPYVQRDRTFQSALVLKRWMKENNLQDKKVNLASLGPHSRRSTILFQKAFINEVKVGSIAIKVEDYDQERWYTSSEGVRTTINEIIAYVYVVLLR